MKQIKNLVLITIMLLITDLNAQSNSNIFEIPFRLDNGSIIIDVTINGETKPFLLDSGGPGTVLNLKHFEGKGLETKNNSNKKVSGVTGKSPSRMKMMKISEFSFGDIKISNTTIPAMEMYHMQDQNGNDFYGMIGYNFLKDYDVLYDYDNLIVTLIKPDYFETYKEENLSKNKLSTVPLRMFSHMPVIETKVGKEIITMGVDCGAAQNLIDIKFLDKIKKKTKDLKKEKLIGTGEKIEYVDFGLVKKTKIGKKQFKNLKTYFNDISKMHRGRKGAPEGVIGYEMLSKQKTLVSYARKEMVFIK